MKTNENKEITPKQARRFLWEKGNLTFKLHNTQKEIYDFIKSNNNRTMVICSSRRVGKSFLLCVMAIEECIKKENTIVKFLAPEVKQIRTILRPLMRDALKGCPPEFRPDFKTHDNLYRFPNGSEIQLAGSDAGNAENLRGGSAHICIIDEAGFCSDLKYVINSILLPTTTITKGKVILASTPPRNPDHEFIDFVKEAEYKNALIKKTIYDNPLINEDAIKEIIDALGGVHTTEFRREYLAEIIIDEEKAVIPEFTEEVQKEIIKEHKKPRFFDCYVSMDIGFRDLTVVLFAYYDFLQSKVIIEDEIVLNGQKMTTDLLANEIKTKEMQLWGVKSPLLRVSDNNLIVINDLQVLHRLTFQPTAKDDANASINLLRMYIAQKKIIINPKCKTFIYHLKNATWNKKRTTYERSPDGSHYDAIDSAKYLLRNINLQKNPYPINYEFLGRNNDEVFYMKTKNYNPIHESIKSWFKPRKN